MTTLTPAAGTLDVPGARLHYTVTGSGPLLLTIPGGAADGGMFAALATLLPTDRTVVTYDPRGLSASTVTDPTAATTPSPCSTRSVTDPPTSSRAAVGR